MSRLALFWQAGVPILPPIQTEVHRGPTVSPRSHGQGVLIGTQTQGCLTPKPVALPPGLTTSWQLVLGTGLPGHPSENQWLLMEKLGFQHRHKDVRRKS